MTFDDIARDLGVSKSTVSRALSGKGRIGEETRNRIIAYANHQKLEEEKEQKGELTHNLGVVFPEDVYVNGNPYFHDCLLGICETAAILDYNVLLATGTAMDISKIRKLVEHKKVDGIILTRSLENDKAIEYLLKQNFPGGLTGLSEDERVIQVATDNASAAENMTSRLISTEQIRWIPEGIVKEWNWNGASGSLYRESENGFPGLHTCRYDVKEDTVCTLRG